jgi:hypothetical protein
MRTGYTEMRQCAALVVCVLLSACQNSPTPVSQPIVVAPPAAIPRPVPSRTFPPGFSPARLVGGSMAPTFPSGAAGAGNVSARCTIEASGELANCRVISQSGDPAFADVTLKWLTGSNRPLFRPDIQSGIAKATEYTWRITFLPPGQPAPAMRPDFSHDKTEATYIVVRTVVGRRP